MLSQYRRVQTHHQQQLHRSELGSFDLSYHGYHNAQSNFVGHQSFQQQLFGRDRGEGYLTSAYPNLEMETTSLNSPTSSDLQSNVTISEAGYVNDCDRPCATLNESLNFSGRTGFMLPPNNLSSIPRNAPLDHAAFFNSMVLPEALNSSFTQQNLIESEDSQQASFEPASFGSVNDVMMWNQGLLSPDNSSIFGGDAGTRTIPPNNGNIDVINVNFFHNVDYNPADVDFLNGGILNQQTCLYDPTMSHGTTVQYGSTNVPWTQMDVDLSGAASLFRNEPSRDPGNPGDNSAYSSLSNQPLWSTQESQKSLSTVLGCNPNVFVSDSLARFPSPEATRHLPTLMPKSTPSSLRVSAGDRNKSVTSQSPRKPGCRSGPLDEEGRKSTSIMRHNGACLSCRLRKTKCSGRRGDICKHCAYKIAHSRHRPAPCLRGPLPELKDAFCPSFAFAHLTPTATQSWIKERNLVAVGNEIAVKLSSGPFLSSMSFFVREIWLLDPAFLLLPDLSSDSHDRMQEYASIPSLPYALSDYVIDAVKSECRRYIDAICKSPLHLLEKIEGNTPTVVWKSLEAIWRFLSISLAARQNRLLHTVIKLYWTLYAMGRDINFAEESVTTAVENLKPSPLHPNQSEISARVVTRQIKTAMAEIYKELLQEVLEGLEKEYRSDTRISGAIAFSTNLILCLVVGELQTVFDGLSIYNISEEGEDPGRAIAKVVQCCREVEDVLIYYSWTVFFKNAQRYNPIKDEQPMDDASSQDDGVAGLGDDFRKLLRDFEDDITDLAVSSCAGGSRTVLDFKLFDIRNSGHHGYNRLSFGYSGQVRSTLGINSNKDEDWLILIG